MKFCSVHRLTLIVVLALTATLVPTTAEAATNPYTGSPKPLGDAVDYGDMVLDNLNAPVVGIADLPTSKGYWLLGSDGGVFSFGSAQFYGSTGSVKLNKPVVGMNASNTGNGYRFVAGDGGIFAYGDARFYGSAGSIELNQPIVGMATTPSGNGYWLVASDGGVFAYGDARFYGSTGGLRLNQPIVGLAATPSGNGYWLVARDGGIFAYGDAAFYGSTGSTSLNAPIVAMASTKTGNGYWLAAADGGVFAYGDAVFYGTAGAHGTIVGMARTASGNGYRFVSSRGSVVTDSYAVVRYPDASTQFASSSTYSFAYSYKGQVARWDPCSGPVHYKISNYDLPSGGEQLVQNVVREISAITGIRFTYDGLFSGAATLTSASDHSISIGWLPPGQYSGATGSDGYTQVEWQYDTQRGARLNRANIEVLDVRNMAWYQPNGGVNANYMNVVKHEFGHAVGLDHTPASSQIMYAVTNPDLTGFGAGDLQGLAYVSTSAGCVK